MFRPMLWIFNFLCVIITVTSHSLLRIPTAWSTRESKRNPCGNGNLPGTVPNTAGNANVVPGSTVTGRWDVTAGDGNGPVTITYVTTDAAVGNFNAGATLTMNMPNVPQSGTGQYPFTFNAPPANTCKGGTNGATCYIQFKSTSNWYSCMSMSMLEEPAPTASPIPAATLSPTVSPTPPIPESVCEALPNKNPPHICQGLTGSNILRPYSTTFDDKIAEATGSFTFNRFNPLVFRNGDSVSCGNALAQFYCADVLPSCTPPSLTPTYMCKTRCELAIAECDVDPYHASAFACNLYSNVASDSYGTCPSAQIARTVHLKSRYVGPTDVGGWAPGQKYLDMRLYAGDKLTFKWTGDTDFVKKFRSYADWQACDWTGSEDVAETTPGSKTVEWVTPSVVDEEDSFFFGGSGCVDNENGGMQQSQRLRVVVIAPPQGATIVPLTGGPEIISGSPPTGSPGGFIPDYDDESASVRVNVMMFVLFLSALLMFVL